MVGTISSNSYANLSNVFYVVGSCENAVGGSVQPSESPLSKSADEMLTLASSLGSAFKDGAVSGHPILTWEPDEASLPAGASIAVSYTHLDVYKRQRFMRCWKATRRCWTCRSASWQRPS